MLRSAKLILSSLLIVGWARAQEPASLDSARSDLQALQAGKDSRLHDDPAKLNLDLSLAAPAFAPAPSMPSALAVPAKPAQKPKDDKSHWLIDAVETEKKSHDAHSRDQPTVTTGDAGRQETADGDQASTESGVEMQQDAGSQRKNSETEEKSKTPSTPNPLTPYLGQWMTPQDYGLLSRPSSGSVNEASISSQPVNLPDEAVQNAVPSLSPASSGWTAFAAPPVAIETRQNPYLSGMDFSQGEAAAPALSSAASLAPVQPVQPVAPAAAQNEPSPAAPPPFAPPDDNQKYFPELKKHF